MEYMESKMQDHIDAMEGQRNAIWDEAKSEQLGEAAISGLPPEFPSMNPYNKGEWQYEEYEAAHEHFIMTGLGY